MTETSAAPAATVPDKSLPARFVGVIFSPRETFTAVAAHPRFLGMLLVTLVVSTVLVGGFMLSPTGQQAFLDNMERSGSSPEAIAAMQRFVPYVAYAIIAWTFIGTPIILAIVAGILFGVFMALGGDAKYKQVYSVLVHAGVISVVGALITVPIQFMTGSMTAATNASAFLPMIDDKSFLFFLAQKIDLFTIWLVTVLSIGLAVVYRRKTASIATTLFVLYGLIALGIAAIQAARS